MRFGELLDDALEHVENQAVPGKDGRYSCKVDLIRDALGSRNVHDITPQDISRWLAKWMRENQWEMLAESGTHGAPSA